MDHDRVDQTKFSSVHHKFFLRSRPSLLRGVLGTLALVAGSYGASAWCAPAAGAASGGASSPAGAAVGVLNAKSKAQLCAYEQPKVQAQCQRGGWGPNTVSVKVVKVVTSGDRALVAVIGKVCPDGPDCLTNESPDAGMPSRSLTFAHAWSDTVRSSGLSPIPCVKVDGRWYLWT
jgi:hypothetical protein